MIVKAFDINIIDTSENDTVLSLQKTAVSAPGLIYNGSEDKFQNICTSELSFNFLVENGIDGKFLDLFTGSETRYKVELIDITMPTYPKTIWCGYLLAEQFAEPYMSGDFFVEFVATDGLALLKNKDYPYNATFKNRSVLEVINQCLLLTGLELPIYFTEAVQSCCFTLKYEDLEVNTTSYLDADDKPEDAYTVLEKCIKSIGCKLLLYNGAWKIIGLNKFKQSVFTFYKYTLDSSLNLVYSGTSIYRRDVVSNHFLTTPTISILPPLKKVVCSWDTDATSLFIPSDFAFKDTFEVVSDMGLNLTRIVDWGDGSSTDYYGGYIATPNGVSVSETSETVWYYQFLEDLSGSNDFDTVADLATNYITSSEPWFIESSTDLEQYGSLEIELERPFINWDGYFDKKGEFSVITDNGSGKARIASTGHNLETGDEIIVDAGEDAYDGFRGVTVIDANTFDISADFTVSRIGEWKINPFHNNFYFAITRKDHLDDAEASAELYLSNFSTDPRPDNYFDFKITNSETSFDGGVQSVLKISLNIERILFTETGYYNVRIYPNLTKTYMDGIEKSYFKKRLILTKLNFTYEKDKVIEYSKIRDINFSQNYDLELFHSSSRSNLSNRSFLFSDALQTEIENSDLAVTYPEYYLNDFKRFDVEESVPFYEALVKMHHDLLHEYNFKVNGTIPFLVGPLDIVSFSFKGDKQYYPINLQLDLTEGLTALTMVELKNENVTDYAE